MEIGEAVRGFNLPPPVQVRVSAGFFEPIELVGQLVEFGGFRDGVSEFRSYDTGFGFPEQSVKRHCPFATYLDLEPE